MTAGLGLGSSRVVAWFDVHVRSLAPTILAVVGMSAYLALLAWAWQHTSYDIWGAIIIAPLLIALTVPMARRIAHDEGDPTLARLLVGALALKLVMSLARYAIAFAVYDGDADAAGYDAIGRELAALFRSGDLRTLGNPLSGTGFIAVLTGAVYTITWPTKLGGFLVFAWFGFWGLYFFYRAFRVAVPDGDGRRYAHLLFFLPSMLFWPSSIGKEAWMCLTLGLASYGTAKLFAGQRGGTAMLVLGITGVATVRPHVGLMFFAGVAVAYLVRRSRGPLTFGQFVGKVVGTVLLVGGGVVLVAQVEEFLELDSLQKASGDALEQINVRTDQGGSSFDAGPATSPRAYALAVVTVLFRPFPNEAGNVQGVLAAAEGMFMLGMCLVSLPRIVPLAGELRRRPYELLAITYVLVFCYAFASIGNFGILTRQRVQVLPFLLVVLCLPRSRRLDPPARAPDAVHTAA